MYARHWWPVTKHKYLLNVHQVPVGWMRQEKLPLCSKGSTNVLATINILLTSVYYSDIPCKAQDNLTETLIYNIRWTDILPLWLGKERELVLNEEPAITMPHAEKE